MKHKAQLVATSLLLISFIKSFKYPSNSYDIVFILVCASIYLVYEFLSNTKLKQQVDKLALDTDERFKSTDKEMKETKGYVSTMSLGSTFNRK